MIELQQLRRLTVSTRSRLAVAHAMVVALGTVFLFALLVAGTGSVAFADGWQWIGTPAARVYVGAAGIFATNPSTGEIWRYEGKPGWWTRIGGPGSTFAVNEQLYGLTSDKQQIVEFTGTPNVWTQIGGPAGTIVAGAYGLFATSPTTGDIYRYDGKPGAWTHIGGPGSMFAVGLNKLYGLTPDKQHVMEFSGTPNVWYQIGGPATNIMANGTLYATNPNGSIYMYNAGRWTQIGGPGSMFVAPSDGLFGLTVDKQQIWEYRADTGGWSQIGTGADAIFSGVVYTNQNLLVSLAPGTHDVYLYSRTLPSIP